MIRQTAMPHRGGSEIAPAAAYSLVVIVALAFVDPQSYYFVVEIVILVAMGLAV
jgi:hypothetical protein